MDGGNYLKLRKVSFLVVACCLAALFFSGFDVILSKTRDVKRRADINVLVQALDLYYGKFGHYPESTDDWQGWDLTSGYRESEPGFLQILKTEGFLDKTVVDSVNNVDYYYRYRKYPAGSFGCDRPFYILQIVNFELPAKNIGRGQCPDFDWTGTAANGYTVQRFD